jgi:hypothetical protein
MEVAFSIGISISEFWEITPYELRTAIKGFGKRKEREAEEYQAKFKNEQDLLTYQAYLISRWVWAKKVDINAILKEKPKKKEMTDDEMLQQVMKLNALFGGEVKTNGTTAQ